MNRALTLICGLVGGVLLTLTIAADSTKTKEGQEVIRITKAEWTAAMAKNTGTALKNVHQECTMFVVDFPNRMDGKDALYRFRDAQFGGSGALVMAEMANEKVQVFGNTAILSYNFMGMSKDKDGVVKPIRSKSTRIYINEGGKWMLVHANFAPIVDQSTL